MEQEYVIGVDIGTMETKAVAFTREGKVVGKSGREIPIYFPNQGMVEQDLEDIWNKTFSTIKKRFFI